jgi:hypothetical protein
MLSVACTFYELCKTSKLQIKQPCKIHQKNRRLRAALFPCMALLTLFSSLVSRGLSISLEEQTNTRRPSAENKSRLHRGNRWRNRSLYCLQLFYFFNYSYTCSFCFSYHFSLEIVDAVRLNKIWDTSFKFIAAVQKASLREKRITKAVCKLYEVMSPPKIKFWNGLMNFEQSGWLFTGGKLCKFWAVEIIYRSTQGNK